MKIEIIMAVRGEQLDNVKATLESIGGAAPTHIINDGIENPPIKVSMVGERSSVPWDNARGCAQARHWGITQSKADIVVLIDGHMKFPEGWLKQIEKHLKKHPQDMVCCQTQALDWKSWNLITPVTGSDKERIYTGAFLSYKKQENWQPGYDYHAIKGSWNPKTQKPGEIGCIMGACYAFKREWYKTIGEPLQICDEWGQDEEVLSLGTHFIGGNVVCLPIVVGHVFNAKRINRTDSFDHLSRRIASRHAVLRSIPMPEDEYQALSEFLSEKVKCMPHWSMFLQQDRIDLCEELKTLWACGPVSWETLKNVQYVRELTADEHKIEMGFRAGRKYKDDPVQPKDQKLLPVLPYRNPLNLPPAAINSFDIRQIRGAFKIRSA